MTLPTGTRPAPSTSSKATLRFLLTDATMKDPEFIADVKRNKFELEPEDGQHLAALIDKIYATPKSVIERVSNLINK